MASYEKTANNEDIKIIYSNSCFEIWIYLHYKFFSAQYTPEKLFQILSKPEHFNQDYKVFKGNRYDKYLYDKINDAMKNADRLFINHSDRNINPYTDVQKAIKDIFELKSY